MEGEETRKYRIECGSQKGRVANYLNLGREKAVPGDLRVDRQVAGGGGERFNQ